MGSASLKFNEPSMEDILASIRRIIAEEPEADETRKTDRGEEGDASLIQASGSEAIPSPLSSVLDITERHLAALDAIQAESPNPLPFQAPSWVEAGYQEERPLELPSAQASTQAEANNALVAAQTARVPQETAAPAFTAPRPEPLLSDGARASVSEAFGRLGSVLMSQEPRTLEDLMKEMLRPMLREWLDAHLPGIVERLVQAEIERLSRGSS